MQLLPTTARQELQRATFSDRFLVEVIDCLQNGWLKSDTTDKDLMPYYCRCEYLTIVNHTLVSDEKLEKLNMSRNATIAIIRQLSQLKNHCTRGLIKRNYGLAFILILPV